MVGDVLRTMLAGAAGVIFCIVFLGVLRMTGNIAHASFYNITHHKRYRVYYAGVPHEGFRFDMGGNTWERHTVSGEFAARQGVLPIYAPDGVVREFRVIQKTDGSHELQLWRWHSGSLRGHRPAEWTRGVNQVELGAVRVVGER